MNQVEKMKYINTTTNEIRTRVEIELTEKTGETWQEAVYLEKKEFDAKELDDKNSNGIYCKCFGGQLIKW